MNGRDFKRVFLIRWANRILFAKIPGATDKSVPQNAKNIAWLDCDVIFERPDWMHEAERKLSEANVVQLYS